MRKSIFVANWKMNKTLPEVEEFVRLTVSMTIPDDHLVIIAPSYPFLAQTASLYAGNRITVAAQNIYYAESGAFTGEVSCAQIASTGATAVIIGHSERREFFGEKNGFLNKKVHAALEAGLAPIYCVGETATERANGKHKKIIRDQIQLGLAELSDEKLKKIIIAYEPVWAIGTGTTANNSNIAEIHSFLRTHLPDETPIIYGGSVNAENAQQLFMIEYVDGFLVGSASLDPEMFQRICAVAKKKNS